MNVVLELSTSASPPYRHPVQQHGPLSPLPIGILLSRSTSERSIRL